MILGSLQSYAANSCTLVNNIYECTGSGNTTYQNSVSTPSVTYHLDSTYNTTSSFAVSNYTGKIAFTQDYGSILAGGSMYLEAAGEDGDVSAIIAGKIEGTVVGIEAINSYNSINGSININQMSGSISGTGAGIFAGNYSIMPGTINIDVSGVITGGAFGGIYIESRNLEDIVTINLNNGADVSATSNIFIMDTRTGSTTLTVNSGSKLSGKVILGINNDNMIINGTSDINAVTLLDGGNRDGIVYGESYTDLMLDLLGSTEYTNKLVFNGTTQSIAGSTMINWQTVTLNNSNVTFINDAALVTGVETNSDGSLQGLVLTNASTLTSPIALAVEGDVNIDSTSTLSHALGGSITGNVTNAGMIYWQNLGQVLTINGNYIGNAGNMSLGTDLGADNSVTDKLVVNGNTSGTTTVTVRPEGTSAGAQTVEGIKIIDIENGTSGATFTLASPLQAGAYEYTLFKNGVSTPTDGDWYLRSTLIPTPTKPIYRPGTSNYVSAQTANAEQGFLALGTLHERMNEQQVASTDKQTWARIYGNTESNNGDSRFNYNQHVRAAQVGQDLYNKTTDNGTNVHSGIMFDYSYSTVDFADRVREDALLDNTTGTMNGTSYGLGGYYTAINGDDSYLDVVGMVSKLENKYKDSYGMKSTQDGYRLGLSVEAGKKLVELGKWKVEGQGQLAYQYTNYDNFNDDISGIDAYGASTLRGRLGVRVYRHLESTKNIQQIDNAQVYGVANVIQDFINPTDVAIGGANVSEKFDKTTLEIGGGFQVPVTGTTYVYTDARYDRSISGNKEQGKLTIGFKTQF